MRCQYPALFAEGDYRPLPVKGHGRDRVIAFERRHGDAVLTCVMGLRLAPLMDAHGQVDWRDTAVMLADGSRLVADLLADGPVWYDVRPGTDKG